MWALVFVPWVCYLDYMKSGGKAIVWLLAGFAMACEGATQANNSASSSDGPYRAIVDRNVFDLRPVPVAPVVTDTAGPPPNVKFIGVMRITDRVQGVFSVQDPTPGKQPVSYILSEDQRQGTLEVKSINLDGKSARVQIGESTVVLKLEEPKAPTAPAPAAAPGLAAGPGQRTFVPGGRAGGRGAFPMPTPTPGQPAPAGGAPSASYSPGGSPDAGNGTLPNRPVRTDATEQPMSAEQQVIAIEQNRNAYQQAGSPLADLLPPTALTGALQAQQNGGADQQAGGNTAPTTSTPQLPIYMRSRTTGTYAPPPPMP